jgi:dTDP-4-dehydrorhamnose 3,5-epimerase-like enzyme
MLETRKPEIPRMTKGKLFVDDRGEVAFFNDFKLEGIKRFYLVSNHKVGFVRAWHAHRHEAKYVTAVSGAALIGAVRIDKWDKPSKQMHVSRFTVTAKAPSILYIPRGYANGFMSLTEDCSLLFLSTSTIEESKRDDVRFDSRYWNIWTIPEH